MQGLSGQLVVLLVSLERGQLSASGNSSAERSHEGMALEGMCRSVCEVFLFLYVSEVFMYLFVCLCVHIRCYLHYRSSCNLHMVLVGGPGSWGVGETN